MIEPTVRSPTSESQRDAIVTWLEKDDNFLRVTAFSAPSGVYSRRSGADLQQIESKALSELAAAVNVASPRAFWDGKHAKQMLKHYLMEFKVTAREASQPGFMLSTTDKAFGIQTIEDKLNSMCRHFVRLQMLHGPRIRAAMRGSISLERNKEKKIPQQENVIPAEGTADQSNQKGATTTSRTPERTESPRPDQGLIQADENSAGKDEDTMERNGLSLRLGSVNSPKEIGGGSVTKPPESNKNGSPKELPPQKNGKKRAVSAKHKYQEQQKKRKEEAEKKRVATMPEFIELTSDDEEEDEELPFLSTNSSTIKVGRRSRRTGLSKSANSDEDEPWLTRKLRRVEANQVKAIRAETHRTPPRTRSDRTPPRTTRSSTSEKTPGRVTRSTPNRSKKSPASVRKPAQKIVQVPKPAKPANKTIDPNKISTTHASKTTVSNAAKSPVSGQESMSSISPVPEPAKVANITASDDPQGKEATTTSTAEPQTAVEAPAPVENATQGQIAPQNEVQAPSPPQVVAQASVAPPQLSKDAADAPAQVAPAQTRFQVPEALRSAIAQVVSQRQELLNSRWSRRQIRQPDFSDSDYALSDHEQEEEKAKASTPPKAQRRRKAPVSKLSRGHSNNQDPPAATNTTAPHSPLNARKLSSEGSSAISRASSVPSVSLVAGRPKTTLMAGNIPPLLNVPRTIAGDSNFERKRAFFRAKKLAFEQFKWIRENELQQQEMELLRREMETREAFAQKEIELQRMNIRAEIIQRMVLTGASVEDIAERLTLL